MVSTTNQKNYTVPIVMMVILFAMIAFVTNLAAPMGIVLKNQFGASNFEGMLGNFANFAAYFFMGIPAGKLIERIGYKKTALIGVAVGFIGMVIQLSSGFAGSFAVYVLGAFVAGFSMCILNTVVNPMLNTLGGGGNRGNQLVQTGGTLNSLCGTIVPMLVGALVGDVTKANISNVYPVMYIAMGIFAVIFIVLYLVSIPEPHVSKSGNVHNEHSPWSFRHFVLGAIGIGIYVGIEVGIPGTMILFLSDPNAGGVSATTAGFVAGTYWFLMLVGRFTAASIGGKVSSKAMLTGAAAIGFILVMLAMFSPTTSTVSMPVLETNATGALSFGMVQVPINALYLVLCGLCTSVMWGGIFNLAVEGLGKYVAAASGIFMMMVCGGGIFPQIQNAIADATTYMTSYWVPALSFAYLFFYATVGSKNVNKDIPVE